ncbi:MAG: prepilin-type N-terminal cleavage/methylation domain-containing protein [Clostridiales bacterium]|jgi:prepilin-type N-terminal cleavage/methylation domain-containing protein|nr:prepilin-type N-terminal cleavage/methylation domain-containing protein [Clostridiales bacterium]
MNTKKAGVTLIELIIVLSVIGICLSAAALTLSGGGNTGIVNALKTLQSDMRGARHLSINESVYTRISFDNINHGYFIQKRVGTQYELVESVKLKGVKVEVVSSPNKMISFTERGTPSSACTITLSSKSHIGKITVNVGSGRVKITEISKK